MIQRGTEKSETVNLEAVIENGVLAMLDSLPLGARLRVLERLVERGAGIRIRLAWLPQPNDIPRRQR